MDNDFRANVRELPINDICDVEDKTLEIIKISFGASFREYNEIAFHTLVELLLPRENYLSEMRLVKDFKKNTVRYGFIDVFVCDYYGFKSVVLELKCFSVLGLYNGKMGAWKEGMIDWESLIDSAKI